MLKKNPSVFSEKTYRDEPIIRTAAQLKNFEPPQYREMRKISLFSYEKGWSQERIFYEQAKFMENFEDDYALDKSFSSYFPTYSAMNLSQQRGYFSWRTHVRHGEIIPSSASFAFVYMYELLALVGVKSPEEGLKKLIAFLKSYAKFYPELSRYADVWIKDFIAFYDLKTDIAPEYCSFEYEDNLSILQECQNIDNERLFEAINKMSAYDFERSPFFENFPDAVKTSVCRSYREMRIKYAKTHKGEFEEKLFGRICTMPYTVFGSAVFYDRTNTKNHKTEFNKNFSYTFTDGECLCRRNWSSKAKSPELGKYLMYVDSVLRDVFGFEKKLQANPPVKAFEKIALEAATSAFEIETEQRLAKERAFVDVSLLGGIMKAADKTKEMLITDEETDIPDEAVIEKATEAIPEEKPVEKAGGGVLSAIEAEFVKCLLKNENISEYANKNGIKINLLCDGINEKLFSEFFDTVIDFDGDMPYIIEDYAEDLLNLI